MAGRNFIKAFNRNLLTELISDVERVNVATFATKPERYSRRNHEAKEYIKKADFDKTLMTTARFNAKIQESSDSQNDNPEDKYITLLKANQKEDPTTSSEKKLFGNLGGLLYERVELDADELKEDERLKDVGRVVPRNKKPTPGQYADLIKEYVNKGDLDSAEKVIALCKENKDKPTEYMYTLLLKAFADQGDIKTCYRLYTEMKSRKMSIRLNTYTSLLNACANSTERDKALQYLKKIRDYMGESNFKFNNANYNVLVKAYGRHGELDEAYKIVHHMIEKNLPIGITTFNSLMYAVNSDSKSGLGHIVKIWQMMKKLFVPPDIFTYNLLLRGIRDTKFGDFTIKDLMLTGEEYPAIVANDGRPDLLMFPPVFSTLPLDNIMRKDVSEAPKLLESPKSENKSEKVEMIKSSSATEPRTTLQSSNTVQVSNSTEHRDIEPTEDSSVTVSASALNEVVEFRIPDEIANIDLDAVLKQNKLILFGGINGMLKRMKDDKITPDVKTLTYLMQLVPPSTSAENEIVKIAKASNVELDIDFYNMLIKKRGTRGARRDAKAVLDDIHRADLKPNIVTFGVLAISCQTAFECRELLKTMKSMGRPINKYIATTMISNAMDRRDFGFILEMMDYMHKKKIHVEEFTFEKMDEFQQKMTQLVKEKHPVSRKDNFKTGFSKFNLRYKSWQEQMGRTIITERVSKEKKAHQRN
ncbi:hypothetical protein TKK_0015069 [Trichogramma kaykai]|uniref:PROP1-like PPR domain-containing protein n=1 Tax=Trichogramma kaykai TaxID=54128 RepID=A0ABD2WAZ3_9HYME